MKAQTREQPADADHTRTYVRRNVLSAVWRVYRRAKGQKLFDLHCALFYDSKPKLAAADTIEVSHPILAGSIPLGIAAGERRRPRDRTYNKRNKGTAEGALP